MNLPVFKNVFIPDEKLFSLEWLKAYLDEFNNRFPYAQAQCVSETGRFIRSDCNLLPQDFYEIEFLRFNHLSRNSIAYDVVGGYTHNATDNFAKADPVGFFLKQDAKFPTYLYRSSFYWEEDERCCYLTSCYKPHELNRHYDFSINKTDAIIAFHRLRPEDAAKFLSLERLTLDLLKEKFLAVSSVAVSRNYKSGWVFHQMNTNNDKIDAAWKGSGCYYDLEDYARSCLYQFMKQYRPHEHAKRMDDLQYRQNLRDLSSW